MNDKMIQIPDRLSHHLKIVAAVVIGGATVWTLYKFGKYFQKSLHHLKRSLAKYRENKEIHLIDSPQLWENFLLRINKKDIGALGIDCEWVVHGKHHGPVSLLQLATSTGVCALVRLSCMEVIPDSLKEILSDRSILKAGVASVDDGLKLQRDYGICVQGCVDLRHLVKRVRGIYNIKSMGLKGLSEAVLDVNLDKDPFIRRGNWEASTYSSKQVEYAANDALAGVDIFTHLVLAKLYGKKPHITEKELMENILDKRFWATARSVCQGIVDLKFNWKETKQKTSKPIGNIPAGILKLSQELEERLSHENNDEADSEERTVSSVKSSKENRAYVVRQRPLYYNCSLLAPDGQLLCICDVRKAEWYIEKGLAERVPADHLTVRLKFEPSGRPETEDDYYLQEKENICVVCGSEEKLIRKQVVPKEYRRFFPTSLKDHASHDVLLLCVSCHQTSTQYDTVLRFQLAEESGYPIDMGSSVKVKADQDLQKVRSAARALLSNKDKIPEKRKEELKTVVLDFYGVSELSEELLRDASEMDFRTLNDEYFPHGKGVIRYVRRNGGIFNFERRWRQHFVDTMKPKFLPAKWSVDHRHERSHLYS